MSWPKKMEWDVAVRRSMGCAPVLVWVLLL